MTDRADMTGGVMDDYMVTVCSACLTASCWHGLLYCSKARTAGTVEKRASELLALSREHQSYFTRAAILEHTGSYPKELS